MNMCLCVLIRHTGEHMVALYYLACIYSAPIQCVQCVHHFIWCSGGSSKGLRVLEHPPGT